MPQQSSKKKYHGYHSATSNLVVDTIHSNTTYCRAFAADTDTALFELSLYLPLPKMLRFLSPVHVSHPFVPPISASWCPSSSAAAPINVIISLDFLKAQNISDMQTCIFTGRSNPGSDLRSEQVFFMICDESCREKGWKMRQFRSNRYEDSADIIMAFIVALTSTNIGMKVIMV